MNRRGFLGALAVSPAMLPAVNLTAAPLATGSVVAMTAAEVAFVDGGALAAYEFAEYQAAMVRAAASAMFVPFESLSREHAAHAYMPAVQTRTKRAAA